MQKEISLPGPAGAPEKPTGRGGQRYKLKVSLPKAALATAAWAEQVTRSLEDIETGQERLDSRLELLQATLTQTASRTETLVSTVTHLKTEGAQVIDLLRRLGGEQSTFGRNLEQVRLLQSALDRKLERLTSEFIEREVAEPLFKEFLAIYQSLLVMSKAPTAKISDEVQALSESVQRFLSAFNLRVIAPSPGERFNPREHEPVQQHATSVKTRHGLVAETFQFGLGSSTRVIQAARVAIFVCQHP